jgi:CrcB protein
MRLLIPIAVGGSAGALMRYWIANGIYAYLGRGFPHGTLFINVSGSFLMGVLTELMLQRFPMAAEYRAGLLIGFLGAYTTFSTFAIETFWLIEEGSYWKASFNMVLSVVLCMVAVWMGVILGRRWFSAELYPWLGEGWGYAKLTGVLVGSVLAGLVTELALRYSGFPISVCSIILIVLFGFMTILLALTALPEFSEHGSQAPVLAGLFVVSALGSAISVGLGVTLGRLL